MAEQSFPAFSNGQWTSGPIPWTSTWEVTETAHIRLNEVQARVVRALLDTAKGESHASA